MKKKFFFLPLLAALALTGCSSEELQPVNPTPDEAGFSDNYMTVCVEMPTAPNAAAARLTRTEGLGDNDKDKFDNGTPEESDVQNVVFFFFDKNNNCVDVQKIDRKEDENLFNPITALSNNPYITRYGTREIRLKSNVDYSKVAVALNTSVETASALKDDISNTGDLEARWMDYIKDIKRNGSNQVMSNSVYYEMDDASIKPTDNKKVLFISIDQKKHVYTSTERSTITDGGLPKGKEYVEVFVERVAARVDVTAKLNMDDYYIYQDGEASNAPKVKTLTLFDYNNLTSKEITIIPQIKGITLNVLANDAKLIKSVNNVENIPGYSTTSTNYNAFQWNDPKNKRCYWGAEIAQTMKYYSWTETEGKNIIPSPTTSAFSQYIHPNTQASRPTTANENQKSLNTKVMVVAELHYALADDETSADQGTIDLVRYGADYMLASSMKAYAANTVNEAVRKIDWNTVELVAGVEEGETRDITEDERKSIAVAVSRTFATGLTGAQFEIVESNNTTTGTSWEASIQKVKNFSYTIDPKIDEETTLNAELVNAAISVIDPIINTAIATINTPTILYWKNGKTYFYTTIKQQGFYGLVGGGKDNYLNGVVRNHIYKVDLTGIYGLGTPVINPDEPIDPERPDDQRPTYLQAQINILPWRVVNNSATIH